MLAAQTQTRIATGEARERRRQEWLRRVDAALEKAEAWDPEQAPDPALKHLDTMFETASESDVLTSTDKHAIRGRVKLVEVKVLERHIDFLLECTMSATRDRNRQDERQALLTRVNQTLASALRLGGPPTLKDSVKQRLGIIRETSAAGDSAKARENAEREAARKEAVYPNERRTFVRWTDPPLVVVLAGKSYESLDWSLGGIAIGEVPEADWHRGQLVDVKIGLARDKLRGDRMEVVRYDPETGCLGMRSRRFASVLMLVKHDCDVAGLDPM
jgi:hypothetical protein